MIFGPRVTGCQMPFSNSHPAFIALFAASNSAQDPIGHGTPGNWDPSGPTLCATIPAKPEFQALLHHGPEAPEKGGPPAGLKLQLHLALCTRKPVWPTK